MKGLADIVGSGRAFHALAIRLKWLFLQDSVLEMWGCKTKLDEVQLFTCSGET